MSRETGPAPSELSLRQLASRMGYRLETGRGRIWHITNRLGYVIVDPWHDICVAGANYDLDAEAVEDYLSNILPDNSR